MIPRGKVREIEGATIPVVVPGGRSGAEISPRPFTVHNGALGGGERPIILVRWSGRSRLLVAARARVVHREPDRPLYYCWFWFWF
jgi:hypothetical protein